jgi:hypothetical protein
MFSLAWFWFEGNTIIGHVSAYHVVHPWAIVQTPKGYAWQIPPNEPVVGRGYSTRKAVNLVDYTPHPFRVTDVDLVFLLSDTNTNVKSTLTVQRRQKGFTFVCVTNILGVPLVLQGRNLELRTIFVDKKVLAETDYTVTDEELIIHCPLPDQCTLEIETEINPKNNTELNGTVFPSRGFSVLTIKDYTLQEEIFVLSASQRAFAELRT